MSAGGCAFNGRDRVRRQLGRRCLRGWCHRYSDLMRPDQPACQTPASNDDAPSSVESPRAPKKSTSRRHSERARERDEHTSADAGASFARQANDAQ
jgi:hypothetical protein